MGQQLMVRTKHQIVISATVSKLLTTTYDYRSARQALLAKPELPSSRKQWACQIGTDLSLYSKVGWVQEQLGSKKRNDALLTEQLILGPPQNLDLPHCGSPRLLYSKVLQSTRFLPPAELVSVQQPHARPTHRV